MRTKPPEFRLSRRGLHRLLLLKRLCDGCKEETFLSAYAMQKKEAFLPAGGSLSEELLLLRPGGAQA